MTDAGVDVHEAGMRMLEFGLTYDQLDIVQLASFELVRLNVFVDALASIHKMR